MDIRKNVNTDLGNAASICLGATKLDDLAAVRVVATARDVLRVAEDNLVLALRQSGHSWQAIGDALGITRQAAHERHRYAG